jgi:hypothetical protein
VAGEGLGKAGLVAAMARFVGEAWLCNGLYGHERFGNRDVGVRTFRCQVQMRNGRVDEVAPQGDEAAGLAAIVTSRRRDAVFVRAPVDNR